MREAVAPPGDESPGYEAAPGEPGFLSLRYSHKPTCLAGRVAGPVPASSVVRRQSTSYSAAASHITMLSVSIGG